MGWARRASSGDKFSFSRARKRAEAGPRGTTIPGTGTFHAHRHHPKLAKYVRPRKGGGRKALWPDGYSGRVDHGPDA